MTGQSILPTVGLALPVGAMTQPSPFDPVTKADKTPSAVQLVDSAITSGTMVEYDVTATTLRGSVCERRPGPVPTMNDLASVRVLACAADDFVANARSVNSRLSTTEFLRAQVLADKAVRIADVKMAAKVVYGKVIVLRGSEQSRACNTFFPALKPAVLTGFTDRTNVEQK